MLSSQLLLCQGLELALCCAQRNGRNAFGRLSLAVTAALAALLGRVPSSSCCPLISKNLLLLAEAKRHTTYGGRVSLSNEHGTGKQSSKPHAWVQNALKKQQQQQQLYHNCD